mgnify:CR=1 FL=1
MGLNDFIITKERALPIFILADVSGSMRGMKIQAVNKALQDMVATLRNVDDIRGVFKLSIITFGGDNEVIVQNLPTDIKDIQLSELSAAGRTPMGAAIAKLQEIIEDKEIVKSKDFQPTVVLISDGCPTDYEGKEYDTLENYMEWTPIKEFHTASRCSKCMRIAMSVDDATDLNMLRAFLNNGTEPMKATNASDIAKVFKWITMSTVSRMSSTNPDNVQSFLRFDTSDDDILV